MESKWWYFLAGGAVVFVVGAFVLFPRSDSTLFSCGTGKPLASNYQLDENGNRPEILDVMPFSWYSGESSVDDVREECARSEANAMTRALACTLIRELDGRDDLDVLQEAWAADEVREQRFGPAPDASTYPMELRPPPSYLLRGNLNQGDGWEDWSASSLLVWYDRDDQELTLSDICFGEWFQGFELSPAPSGFLPLSDF